MRDEGCERGERGEGERGEERGGTGEEREEGRRREMGE